MGSVLFGRESMRSWVELRNLWEIGRADYDFRIEDIEMGEWIVY